MAETHISWSRCINISYEEKTNFGEKTPIIKLQHNHDQSSWFHSTYHTYENMLLFLMIIVETMVQRICPENPR